MAEEFLRLPITDLPHSKKGITPGSLYVIKRLEQLKKELEVKPLNQYEGLVFDLPELPKGRPSEGNAIKRARMVIASWVQQHKKPYSVDSCTDPVTSKKIVRIAYPGPADIAAKRPQTRRHR